MAIHTKRDGTQSTPASGVVAYIDASPSGAVRLVMDDVRRRGTSWARASHFTARALDGRAFRTMALTRDDTRAIGEALIVRLAALDAAARAPGVRRRFLGCTVVFDEMPWWTRTLPKKSRRVFAYCRGRPYRVVDVDAGGMLVLDVSADVDARFGGHFNDIRLDPDLVRVVRKPKRSGAGRKFR